MAVSEEYVAYLVDLYEGKFVLSFKKMFGGMGVYMNGLSVGVIAEETFYGKTDAESRADYIAEGEGPFRYVSRGVEREIHAWYRMPDSAMEDPSVFTRWMDRCYDAALAANREKEQKKARQQARKKKKS